MEQIISEQEKATKALKDKVANALKSFENKGLTVIEKNGKIYVSLEDKLLFSSGSTEVDQNGQKALQQLAAVLANNPEIAIMIEGHTDNVPIATDCIDDNWDLSVKRATSIVRLMQTKFGVEPERMTAGGRSEYIPKKTNKTSEGRTINRRTEIIILPELDQLFKLLEPPTTVLN